MNFEPQGKEEHEFTIKYWTVFVQYFVNILHLQDFPLNVPIWSLFICDCSWASSWLTKDNEDVKRMTMNSSIPRKKDLIQSVQRQVKTLIERKDAKNMQIFQDWNTFRCSRITLLSDPAAKLIRQRVHVLSDSKLCAGVSNPDPFKIG